MTHNLVLLDGNALMHRAYYGVGKGQFIPIHNNMPVGMVYGFISTFLHVWRELEPTWLVITFDTKEKTFRHELDENYKAQREKAPDDFYAQIPLLYDFLSAAQIPYAKAPGFESDDLIGCLTHKARKTNLFDWIFIVSSDMDFLQLVDKKTQLIKLNGNMRKIEAFGVEETLSKLGIRPDQVIDYKALCGDSADNYKGLEGVGPKTASQLLQRYETIEGIYAVLEDLPEKLQAKFHTQKDVVLHCRTLATILEDCPVEMPFHQPYTLNQKGGEDFLMNIGFPSLLTRWKKLFQQQEPQQKSMLEGLFDDEE